MGNVTWICDVIEALVGDPQSYWGEEDEPDAGGDSGDDDEYVDDDVDNDVKQVADFVSEQISEWLDHVVDLPLVSEACISVTQGWIRYFKVCISLLIKYPDYNEEVLQAALADMTNTLEWDGAVKHQIYGRLQIELGDYYCCYDPRSDGAVGFSGRR